MHKLTYFTTSILFFGCSQHSLNRESDINQANSGFKSAILKDDLVERWPLATLLETKS